LFFLNWMGDEMTAPSWDIEYLRDDKEKSYGREI
jgi:hypothetical protein